MTRSASPKGPGRARARTRSAVVVLALTAALAAGCGVVPELPGPMPTDFVPSVAPLAEPTARGDLSQDGFDQMLRMAVRIRNVGCGELSTGSGFAIAETTLITNRHVVADSAELQIATYDGRDVKVSAASSAGLADLALVRTTDPLPTHPELAPADPTSGDKVSVVGYPEGGELTVTEGHVIAQTTDPLNENLGQVLVTDAPVEPGSSGSAVLNTDGQVVGVVYAKNSANQSFIVPVSTLRSLLDDETAFTPLASCSR